jgi:hypothetical protein
MKYATRYQQAAEKLLQCHCEERFLQACPSMIEAGAAISKLLIF